jgi:hypothetical protein
VASEALSEAKNSVQKQCVPLGIDTVRLYLERDAEKYAEMYSRNHWKAAIYTAMANEDGFVAFCCKRQ